MNHKYFSEIEYIIDKLILKRPNEEARQLLIQKYDRSENVDDITDESSTNEYPTKHLFGAYSVKPNWDPIKKYFVTIEDAKQFYSEQPGDFNWLDLLTEKLVTTFDIRLVMLPLPNVREEIVQKIKSIRSRYGIQLFLLDRPIGYPVSSEYGFAEADEIRLKYLNDFKNMFLELKIKNEKISKEIGIEGLNTNGTSLVKIGIVDSGISENVISQKFKVEKENNYKNFIDNDPNIHSESDLLQHGSQIYSLIFGDKRTISFDINPEVKFNFSGLLNSFENIITFVAKVIVQYDNTPTSYGIANYVQLMAAFLWLIDNKVDVINLSLTSFEVPSMESGFSYIVSKVTEKDIIVVIAAGNSGSEPNSFIMSPGDVKTAITVGAIDFNGNLAEFSSKGDPDAKEMTNLRNKPDLVAFGKNIFIPVLKDTKEEFIEIFNGTSFSAPIVTAQIALLVQHAKDKAILHVNDYVKSAINYLASTDNLHKRIKNEKGLVGQGFLNLSGLSSFEVEESEYGQIQYKSSDSKGPKIEEDKQSQNDEDSDNSVSRNSSNIPALEKYCSLLDVFNALDNCDDQNKEIINQFISTYFGFHYQNSEETYGHIVKNDKDYFALWKYTSGQNTHVILTRKIPYRLNEKDRFKFEGLPLTSDVKVFKKSKKNNAIKSSTSQLFTHTINNSLYLNFRNYFVIPEKIIYPEIIQYECATCDLSDFISDPVNQGFILENSENQVQFIRSYLNLLIGYGQLFEANDYQISFIGDRKLENILVFGDEVITNNYIFKHDDYFTTLNNNMDDDEKKEGRIKDFNNLFFVNPSKIIGKLGLESDSILLKALTELKDKFSNYDQIKGGKEELTNAINVLSNYINLKSIDVKPTFPEETSQYPPGVEKQTPHKQSKIKYTFIIAMIVFAISIFVITIFNPPIPPKPSLLSPTNGETIKNSQVLFKWKINEQSERPLEYNLFIGNNKDSLEKNPYQIQSTTFLYQINKADIYYWKINTINRGLFKDGFSSSDTGYFFIKLQPSIDRKGENDIIKQGKYKDSHDYHYKLDYKGQTHFFRVSDSLNNPVIATIHYLKKDTVKNTIVYKSIDTQNYPDYDNLYSGRKIFKKEKEFFINPEGKFARDDFNPWLIRKFNLK